MGLFHLSGNTDTIFHYTHVIEFNIYSLKINDNNNQTAKHLGENHIHKHTVYILYTVFILFTYSLQVKICAMLSCENNMPSIHEMLNS